jgi:hypothetical protein
MRGKRLCIAFHGQPLQRFDSDSRKVTSERSENDKEDLGDTAASAAIPPNPNKAAISAMMKIRRRNTAF